MLALKPGRVYARQVHCFSTASPGRYWSVFQTDELPEAS